MYGVAAGSHLTSLAVRTAGLTKAYAGRTVVAGLNLEIPSGVVSGFVGPNGAGKTTTIRLLLGLVRPTAGTGSVLGEPLQHPARYLWQVGAMIEGPAFMPGLSGHDNLLCLAQAGGLPPIRVRQALERVGLADRGRDKVRSYSLGMKQRLGIAAALLPAPRLLVLDEPTNGLDPAGIAQMRELIASFRDEGMTVFVSSHLLSEVELVADHLVVIRAGSLVFQGTVQQLAQSQVPHIIAAVEHAADAGVVADIAGALDWDCEITAPGEVRAPLPPTTSGSEASARAAELNRRCHAAGVTLIRLDVSRPTLEDAFFGLTGTSSGDIR
ncbi:ABC transporter ATP-binding protein [Catellatospora sp. NPDC049609]|uniref:ABC transporter ATP-binding protein n=1 Tax=Catellatospora sp. NPDC049609 TaxID=3155505 RepID=UPI00341CE572